MTVHSNLPPNRRCRTTLFVGLNTEKHTLPLTPLSRPRRLCYTTLVVKSKRSRPRALPDILPRPRDPHESSSTASPVTMRPTSPLSHKSPADPSPLMVTLLFDDAIDFEDFFWQTSSPIHI
ncbi:hypothetical protein PMIN06_008737 [Paraphaeosphaeria minitans]